MGYKKRREEQISELMDKIDEVIDTFVNSPDITEGEFVGILETVKLHFWNVSWMDKFDKAEW